MGSPPGRSRGRGALSNALADPVRVELLALVRQSSTGEACFCDLADQFDMPQSSLSHHLTLLVRAGLARYLELVPGSAGTAGPDVSAVAGR
jgi:DNA-binding transcriptional ArsR family regulator